MYEGGVAITTSAISSSSSFRPVNKHHLQSRMTAQQRGCTSRKAPRPPVVVVSHRMMVYIGLRGDLKCKFGVHLSAIPIFVTRRKLQTPGNAEEHKRQETPTINPIGPTDKPHRPSTKHYRKDSLGNVTACGVVVMERSVVAKE